MGAGAYNAHIYMTHLIEIIRLDTAIFERISIDSSGRTDRKRGFEKHYVPFPPSRAVSEDCSAILFYADGPLNPDNDCDGLDSNRADECKGGVYIRNVPAGTTERIAGSNYRFNISSTMPVH